MIINDMKLEKIQNNMIFNRKLGGGGFGVYGYSLT